MYGQILISNNDQDCRRIIWRRSPAIQIKHYCLRTITYDTSEHQRHRTEAVRTRLQLKHMNMVYIQPQHTYQKPHSLSSCECSLNLSMYGGMYLRKWLSYCNDFPAQLPKSYWYCQFPLLLTIYARLDWIAPRQQSFQSYFSNDYGFIKCGRHDAFPADLHDRLRWNSSNCEHQNM